jgi:PAT family beta-lactamase induction signal transducer AmpG
MATADKETNQLDYPKLVIIGILNMAQTFPAAFTGTALPFLFRKEGLPLEMFWLLALPTMPTWLRWLMALAVDNFGSERFGHRKSWIVPCTLVGTAAYALLAFIPPSLPAVHLIVAILLFKSFVLIAQDVTIDAYAAENMTDRERAPGTAIINWLAGIAGVLGTGTVALVETFGWKPTMLAAAALMLIAATPAMLRPEPPVPEARKRRQAKGQRASLIKTFKRPESGYILPFAWFWGFGAGFMGTMLGPFYADKGLTLTEFGILSPISHLAGSTLAAVTTPLLVSRFGLRSTAMVGVAILPIEGAMFCMFALTSLPPLPLLIVMVSLLGYMTALFTYPVTISRYRWASKAQAGTDYALQSSLAGLGVWMAGSVSGLIASQVGWVYFFPIATTIALTAGIIYVGKFNRIEELVQERERAELERSA